MTIRQYYALRLRNLQDAIDILDVVSRQTEGEGLRIVHGATSYLWRTKHALQITLAHLCINGLCSEEHVER